jgi:endoglucanase
MGRAWNGTPEEMAELRKAFDAVSGWAKKNERPVFMGEFGVIDKAPNTSRARWLRAVTCEARARGFAWGLWDFATNFGAYERATGAWRREILDAISDPPAGCPK